MTHLCEVITFRPRKAETETRARRMPNFQALDHLGKAEDLMLAITEGVAAATASAAAGVSTLGLGSVSDGRALRWALQLSIELASLTNDPHDRERAATLQAWLDEKGATNG